MGRGLRKSIYAVGGNLSFRYDPATKSRPSSVGDVLIANSKAVNGMGSLSPTAPITVKGNLTVTGNGTDPDGSFTFIAHGVRVGGNLVVSGNTRTTSLYGNQVGNNLNCGGNTPAPRLREYRWQAQERPVLQPLISLATDFHMSEVI